LFAQGIQAGEFVFIAQDARGSDGTIGEGRTAADQARHTLNHLNATIGRSLDDLVSLSVFVPDYGEAPAIAEVLRAALTTNYPAVNFVGVSGLDANCRVRM